jgi:hypothetical protein
MIIVSDEKSVTGLAEVELDLIKTQLKTMDSEQKLTAAMLTIYEKFVV